MWRAFLYNIAILCSILAFFGLYVDIAPRASILLLKIVLEETDMKKVLGSVLALLLVFVLCVSVSAEKIQKNVAVGKSYVVVGLHDDVTYPDEDGKSLTDGVSATGGYSDPAWAGFSLDSPDFAEADNKVASVTVDLGETFEVTGLSIDFDIGDVASAIDRPQTVVFYSSSNGSEWTELGAGIAGEPGNGGYTTEYVLSDVSAVARYFKVEFVFTNYWCFVSEFQVFADVESSDESEVETPTTGDWTVPFVVAALFSVGGAVTVVWRRR